LCGNWKGSLGDLKTHHEKECALNCIQCSNQGCQQNRIRKDMNGIHTPLCLQRIITCEYCRVNFKYSQLKDHFKTCEQYPVACDNQGCDVVLPRNQMPTHQTTECAFSIVSCEWCEFGCDHKSTKLDLKNHHTDAIVEHLNCVKNVITRILSILPQDQVKLALSNLNKEENVSQQQGSSSSSSSTLNESFEIHSQNITDDQLLQQFPPQFTQLKKLNLNNCIKLTDNSITKITQNCSQLEDLSLTGCNQITNNSIIQLSQHCKKLQLLDLSFNKQITDQSVFEVVKNCPELNELNLRDCSNVSKELKGEVRSMGIKISDI